jgi:hypothetical protein
MSNATCTPERRRLTIIVSPVLGSPGHFRSQLEGRDDPLVVTSRQPFVDSARVLLALGHDGNADLVMKHAGRDTVALKGRLSIAAKLSVEEGPNGPRLVPHRTGSRPRVAASSIPKTYKRALTLPGVDPRMSGPPTRGNAAQPGKGGPQRQEHEGGDG